MPKARGDASLFDVPPTPDPPGVGSENSERVCIMPSWLLLIIVGAVLVILGVATNIGQFLIWIGVIVLVVSLILGLVGRGRGARI